MSTRTWKASSAISRRVKTSGPLWASTSVRDNECMAKSAEGVYRNGKVELLEPLGEAEGSHLIVTCIVLVLFPDSNLRTSKRRPAVVSRQTSLGTDLPQTIVAMITSNMIRAGHPSRVSVRVASESAKGTGLLMDSVIMTDNLATIPDTEIDRVIGRHRDLTPLDASLRRTLAL